MSTLFIIGNGFDVNCGINTKYRDVYRGYVKANSHTSNLQKFKDTISSDIENWGDFEMAMAKYAETLESEEEFLECIRDFSEYMEDYLLHEMIVFKKNIENENIFDVIIKEMQNSFASFYDDISHNVSSIMRKRNAGQISKISAISFNYTDAFDIFLKECFKRSKLLSNSVIHIHGILQDAPVLGVDNSEQLKIDYNLTRKGKRNFIKPVFNTEYDYERVEHAKYMIDRALTICSFGWSLGESDLTWRNEILSWLRKDEVHHLFIYDYSISQVTYRTKGEMLDIEDDAKGRLLSKWGINADDYIYNQIHIPCGKNIFNIKSVIDSEMIKLKDKEKKMFEEKLKKSREFVEKQLSNTAMV